MSVKVVSFCMQFRYHRVSFFTPPEPSHRVLGGLRCPKSILKTIVIEQVGDSSYNAKAGVTGEKPSPLEVIRK